MSKRSLAFLSTLIAFFSMLLAWTAGTTAAAPEEAVLLVANPGLNDPIYGSTVLLVRPTPDGGHIGLIINKPTTATLSKIFPEHEPSQKIADPIFLGGPADLNVVFALVERHDGPKDGAVQITSDLYLAVKATDVDQIIESEAEHARFFVGLVVWRPGELDDEMERGLWYTAAPDAKLVLRKQTEGLWEELVRRSEERAHAV